MIYHILNGDALAYQFPLEGEVIVCRECLIDGDLSGADLPAFFKSRAAYISGTFEEREESYYEGVVPEFEKILRIAAGSEINLWFEDDLFCQANLWFVFSLIAAGPDDLKIYRVFPEIPEGENHWRGFGFPDVTLLHKAFAKRKRLTAEDLSQGRQLWGAYQSGDLETLKKLAAQASEGFNLLAEVVEAHAERFSADGGLGRPEKTVKKIMETRTSDFHHLFSYFFLEEGIYGFGDTQVKAIYDRLRAQGV
ncbi:DUF1835 domain-containing protein [Emticicia sp. CRIBPO]|uniref:DUF1835 domain-containing protein n=1 Tax=Emticicia sp. CRIBPO TaxID=2683258 RepID=UPI0014130711|nr:DUF1835 domain-containing protein [Emticicia sp. CRIBPO]NBA86817.1 DUF1835 domain-containing protein [Emticicia sp. CRIBPO]